MGSSPSPGIAAAYRRPKVRAAAANEGGIYRTLRVCLTAGMGLTPDSPSDGELAIFVAQQALYRRAVEAD